MGEFTVMAAAMGHRVIAVEPMVDNIQVCLYMFMLAKLCHKCQISQLMLLKKSRFQILGILLKGSRAQRACYCVSVHLEHSNIQNDYSHSSYLGSPPWKIWEFS